MSIDERLASTVSTERRSAPLEVRGAAAYLFGHELFIDPPSVLMDTIGELVAAGGAHLVVTANVDHALNLREPGRLDEAYREASLRLVDGQPIVAALRALGARGVYRNTGADLLRQMAAEAPARGWRVAVFGGADGVAESAVQRLGGFGQGGVFRAFEFPFVDSLTAPEVRTLVQELREFRPDLVFVCVGSPKQEELFLAWRDELPDAVYVGAGAAVDFAAGTRTRAPRWAQRMALEWMWRVAQEPRRLASRYLVKGPEFAGLLAASLPAGRR